MNRGRYQFFDPLPPAMYEALKADIAARGVMVPIEVDEDDNILDGYNRVQICEELGLPPPLRIVRAGLTEQGKVEHSFKGNLLRRHMDDVSWGELYEQLAELRGIDLGRGGDRRSTATVAIGTADQLAREVGVRPRTARRRVQNTRILADAPDLVAQVKASEKPVATAVREKRKRDRNAALAAKPIPPLPPTADLRLGDIAVEMARIEADSIDVIITDPPYSKRYLPLYGILAREAARVLRPGGLLAVMIGQFHLFEVGALMLPHVGYHWAISYLTPGGQAAQIFPRHVNSFWKPVLVFAKLAEGEEYAGPWMGDVARSDPNDNDKQHHEWGQSVSGMTDLVKRLSEPGQIILDPFMGAGTTGVAALPEGRGFIGIDIDPDMITIAQRRLGDVWHR